MNKFLLKLVLGLLVCSIPLNARMPMYRSRDSRSSNRTPSEEESVLDDYQKHRTDDTTIIEIKRWYPTWLVYHESGGIYEIMSNGSILKTIVQPRLTVEK